MVNVNEIVRELPKMNLESGSTGCCPVFDPAPWDKKLFILKDLNMVKASTKSIFFVPINMAKVMSETMKKIEDNNAFYDDKYLILSEDVSPFKCVHHFLVTKEIEGMDNEIFGGKFYTIVFEGNYNQIQKAIERLKNEMEAESLVLNRVFAFYTTCPKCAKVYGKNYIVLFGETF
jgi:hypothetical protein